MGASWPILLLAACALPAPEVPEHATLELGNPERVEGLASIDAGGDAILVVAASNPSSLRWFETTTGLETQPDGEIALSATGPLLSPGDLDQDGYPDLVVAAEEAAVTLLVFGGGPAGLGPEPLVAIPTERVVGEEDVPTTAFALGVGDFDGNGVPEIAVGSTLAQGARRGVSIYSGVDPEAAGFIEPGCRAFGDAVAGTGDVDGDGYDDAVASGACGVLLLAGGRAGLEMGGYAPDGASVDYALCHGPGDLDDDGFADVLCAVPQDVQWDYVPTLALYRGSPTGLVEARPWATWAAWVAPPDFARREVDQDGDGIADLVIGWSDADMGQGGVLVHAGGSSLVQLSLPGQEPGRRLGDEVVTDLDLDEDGLPEIVTSASLPEEGTEEVRVYRGADLWARW